MPLNAECHEMTPQNRASDTLTHVTLNTINVVEYTIRNANKHYHVFV